MTATREAKQVLGWEACGALFVILFGSAFHFVYGWSGRLWIAGLFAPVNESMWEHLKLGYWSMALYAIASRLALRGRVRNPWLARLAAILVLEAIIVGAYDLGTALFHRSSLALSIGSYCVGAVLGMAAGFLVMARSRERPRADRLALALFALFGVVLVLFTVFPPHLPFFMDHNDGLYGFGR